MNWFDSLETFATVAETKSFIQAARMLGTTNSAITKRIQWLEEKLESTLFIRTTRKVLLTEVGEKLLTRIHSLLSEWNDIQARLMDEKIHPSGEITICLPPNFSGLPKFANLFYQFARAYSSLHLHIKTTSQPIHLIDDKIDILIATQKYIVNPTEIIGIKLFDFSYSCFSAKSYIKKNGSPKTPEDLKKHSCIVYGQDNQWEFSNKHYFTNAVFRADSADVMIAMASAGFGIIYIPAFMIEQKAKSGLLQPVLENYRGKQDTLMAFYARHEYKPRKIELFMEFLKEAY